MSNLSEQELIRREKLKKIRELGIEPYPADLFKISSNSKTIKSNFKEGSKVIVAGRLMSRRIQGNASFAELQDSSGRIQVYFNRDEICTSEDKSKYNELYKRLLDIGDIIGIEGELFKTKVGEKTIMVKDFKLLFLGKMFVILNGYPFLSTPAGKEIPGKPAKLTGTVKISFKYIETGSLVFSAILNAELGVEGVKIASTFL